MTTNASRAPVDFDAFERELHHPPSPSQAQVSPQQAQAQHKADPLAELARIVGQDDPFRALLEARDGRTGRGARVEPTFFEAAPDLVAPAPGPGRQAHVSQHGHVPPTPADAFDQYLASVEHGSYPVTREDGHGDHAFEEAQDDRRPLRSERPRQRRRLVSVGAGLAVVAVSVTGALTWRSLHSGGGGSGTVPTILADKAPLKVAPLKADGVEIPDQNKQIYDRTAKDGQIRIVNREEQPIDVAQAARSAQRDGEGGATPGAPTQTASNQGTSNQATSTGQGTSTGPLTESLGEPRRVRTVSVKPDTPVAPPPAREVAEAATATPPAVIPTMTMPGSEGGSTTASLRGRPARIPAAVPAPTVEASAPEPTIPAPAPAPRVKAVQRVAAVAPEATSALPAPAATASTSPVGGYSVQLGVRTSEGEAKTAFKQMQGKYSQLSGQPALIRQAEVNGKTIYRVRVGPLAKADATTLCTELQGAGGQCFVAKN